ncbi:MAG: trypsin-like serine protease [Planctomycetes bacterium]|nr:trypsin-like serine protease [Planctomycetota bacterium]
MLRSVLAGTCLLAALAPTLCAQTAALHGIDVDLGQDTGWVTNPTATEAVTAWFVADVPAAPWVRLHFGQVELDGDPLSGAATRLRLTSLLDLGVQLLDARTSAQWGHTSAYFNGGAVLVELVAPPGAGPSRVRLTHVHAGLAIPGEETICGATDDRVLSNDPRAARVVPVGCTAWLIDDCAKCFLSAGHCAGTSLQVAQFNVPPSTASGSLQHPPPSDQYAIDLASKQTNGGQGIGNDWAYFGVFPNSTTGLTPFQAQGQTYVLAAPPPFAAGDSIRITGYGTDSTPSTSNQVQQTHSGPWNSASGNALNYATDTTGGNSGSPILHEPTGTAIGIHTHGGCSSTAGTGNNGTASTLAALQSALASPLGVCRAGIEAEGPLPVRVPAGVPVRLRMRASAAIVVGSAELRFRAAAGGAFASVPLADLGGGLHEGWLPPFECGDAPQFFFAAQSGGCGLVTSPPGAPAAAYAFEVASAQVLVRDDFETDQGWIASAGAGLTAGNWQRGVPVNGGRGDPPTDADGSGSCWVTGNTAGDSDVDGGTAFLTSPAFDLTGGARIRYQAWLGSTGSLGSGDSLQVQVATNAAGTNWTTLRTLTTPATTWRADELAIGVEVGATSTVRVRIAVTDVSPGNVVEGGFDAFEIVRTTCEELGSTLCSGDGSGTACPCANSGATGRGCAHSQNPLGARLRAFGTASVAADTLTLAADGLPAVTTALFFQGDASAGGGLGVVFGDGLRCASGTVLRLATRAASAGSVAFGAGIPGDPSVSSAGLIQGGGGARVVQVWYRNPADFCTSATFNTTNGVAVVWGG